MPHEPMAAAHLIADQLATIQKEMQTQNALLRRLVEALEGERDPRPPTPTTDQS